MTDRISISWLLGPLLGLFSCHQVGSTDAGEEPSQSPPAQVDTIKRTSDPAIAVKNLEAAIAGMDRQLAISSDLSTRQRFFDLMALRVQMLGRFSDLAAMKQLVQSRLPRSDEEQLFFARYQLLVHEFSAARELVDETPNQEAGSVDLRRTLDLALFQNLPVWLETAEKEVLDRPQFETYANLGSVQAALGLFDAADASYKNAEELYPDVSPFPLAWLAFQRGLMWSESAGDDDRGELHYRRALSYLPQFTVANVHLAELVLDGDRAEAQFLYQRAAQSEDPEPDGKLADFLKGNQPEQALSLQKQATQTYDELLQAYPLAFADHGAEYFSGPGEDPARAVELSLQNLSNRKTPRAFLVALGAAEAARDEHLVCELATQALSSADAHPVLKKRLNRLQGQCGLLK